jgi:DNA helicase-2/ATP-dependent DNA helicase PcrA
LDLIKALNPEQQAAVQQTEGALLIIAGAGSGKTRVLTYRVAYLLQQGVYPERILAITFTNKAAMEMKHRILDMVGEAGQNIWISTFHSMCVKILRRDIEALGFKKSFTILDQDDSHRIIKRLIQEKNLDDKKYPVAAVADAIDRAKNQMISAKEMLKTAKDPFDRNIAAIMTAYERYNLEHHSLDFNDLLNVTIKLFQEHSEILAYYSERFQYIMVDEYQDTNYSQYLLIKMLSSTHGNLCVVGDEDQGIYSWRGADITNILNFEKDYPQVTVIKLEQNYRSTQEILDAAHCVIENNRQRKGKKLWTQRNSGQKVILLEAENGRDEARSVIAMIEELSKEKNLDYDQFAILYRTHAQSRNFEDLCNEQGIPYVLVGGIKFWNRKEIKDILAYCRVMVNPYDDVSLNRIINVPKRGIGNTSFDHIRIFAQEMGIPYYAALEEVDSIPNLQARVVKLVKDFVTLLDNFRKLSAYLSVSEILRTVAEKSGYLTELQYNNLQEQEERRENVGELINVAAEYEKKEDIDNTLEGFLTNAALYNQDEEERSEDRGPRVRLMSLHAAKGLEFPVVFLTGMEENVFPMARTVYNESDIEEERRLCYVGMTRAKDMLFLTYAQTRTTYGFTNYNPRSRFINEVEPKLLQVGLHKAKAKKLDEITIKPATSPFQWENWGKEHTKKQEVQGNKTTIQSSKPIPKSETPASLTFVVGEEVKHKIWNIGTVTKVEGPSDNQEIYVDFPDVGSKRLIVKYAALEKV